MHQGDEAIKLGLQGYAPACAANKYFDVQFLMRRAQDVDAHHGNSRGAPRVHLRQDHRESVARVGSDDRAQVP